MSFIPDKNAIKASSAHQEQADPGLESARCAAEKERVELDGRRAFFQLRQHWSAALMIWISFFIAFHLLLTMGVGLGWFDYREYRWLIPLITVENFLQVVGMGYIVVRFLYPIDLTGIGTRPAVSAASTGT